MKEKKRLYGYVESCLNDSHRKHLFNEHRLNLDQQNEIIHNDNQWTTIPGNGMSGAYRRFRLAPSDVFEGRQQLEIEHWT